MDPHSEIAALHKLCVGELRRKYADVFVEGTNARNKAWLIKRIAWRIQALAEGDLSERARQRAMELARDADLRLSAPRASVAARKGTENVGPPATLPLKIDERLPMPGTIITRTYKHRRIDVTVLARGFEFEGQFYASLSAIAKLVTGAHWNGYHFFGLHAKAKVRA